MFAINWPRSLPLRETDEEVWDKRRTQSPCPLCGTDRGYHGCRRDPLGLECYAAGYVPTEPHPSLDVHRS